MGLFSKFEKALAKDIERFSAGRKRAAEYVIKDPEQVAELITPSEHLKVSEDLLPGTRSPYVRMPESSEYPMHSTYRRVGEDIELAPIYTDSKGRPVKLSKGAGGKEYQPGDPVDFRSTLKSGGTFGVWAEPPQVKKSVDITDAQYQRYLQRVADRSPSGRPQEIQMPGQGPVQMQQAMGNQAAEEMMGQFRAPQSQVMGRLHEPYIEGGEKLFKTMDMPLDEAVGTYMKDHPAMGGPGRFQAKDQYVPPVDQLSVSAEGNVSMSRREWKTFGRQTDKKIEALQKTNSLPQLPKKGPAQLPDPTLIENLVNQTRVLDMIWTQLIGGVRTIQGREWKDMMSKARGYKKTDMPNPKDHFMKVGLKWMRDREGTAKLYPRESVRLEKLWQTLNQAE